MLQSFLHSLATFKKGNSRKTEDQDLKGEFCYTSRHYVMSDRHQIFSFKHAGIEADVILLQSCYTQGVDHLLSRGHGALEASVVKFSMLLSASAVDIQEELKSLCPIKVSVPKHLLAGVIWTFAGQSFRIIDFSVENKRRSLEGGDHSRFMRNKEKS